MTSHLDLRNIPDSVKGAAIEAFVLRALIARVYADAARMQADGVPDDVIVEFAERAAEHALSMGQMLNGNFSKLAEDGFDLAAAFALFTDDSGPTSIN